MTTASTPSSSSSSSIASTNVRRRVRSSFRRLTLPRRGASSSSSSSFQKRRALSGLGDTPASLSVWSTRCGASARSRRGATTTRWASRNDYKDTGATGDGEAGRRRRQRKGLGGLPPDPPALDDILLLLGDCTVLWLYVLYKKVSAVSAMPDFPGWLAPIDVSAQSAAAFAVECAWTLSLWVALSAYKDAYKIDNFKTPTVKDAAVETVNAWVIWAPLQAMGAVMAMKSGLGQAASHGLLVSEVTALGVLLAWRCYAKVFSLLGPSRNADNAGRDDEEWGEFYRMFSGVAIICISCAMVEMIVYGADL